MFKPSQRITEIIESETLAMTKRARELKESGKDIISLSIGEPDFDTPEHIRMAAKLAMDQGHTHYPPVLGTLEFREAIATKLKNDNGLAYSPSQIIVSNGAKHSIINAVLSIINPGDEVVIPAPFWVSYPSMVSYAGGKVVTIPTKVENNFKPTADQLRSALNEKTRLLIFSSPCNPSGTVFTESDLLEWVEVLKDFPQVFVISDEIYEHINYLGKHTSIASFEGMYERTAVVNGLSKGYAMTGWRIGYLAGPQWLVNACEKIQGLFTSGANSVSMKAGTAALLGSSVPVEQMRDQFRDRRTIVLEKLNKMLGVKYNIPEGAFYVFPDMSSFIGKKFGDQIIENTEELCLYLLNEAGVATVSGKAFGIPQCIRISYATDEQSLIKALDRMALALSHLI